MYVTLYGSLQVSVSLRGLKQGMAVNFSINGGRQDKEAPGLQNIESEAMVAPGPVPRAAADPNPLPAVVFH